MERCPNCGAPARPGAKFCTTCGYRLPDSPAASQDEEAAEAIAPAPTSTWPAAAEEPATAPATAAPLDDTGTDSAVIEDDVRVDVVTEAAPNEAAVADSADQVLSSSWPAPSADSWSSGWEQVATGHEADERPAGAAVDAADPDASAWPSPAEPAVDVEETVVAFEAAPADDQLSPGVFGHPPTPSPETNAAPDREIGAESTPVARANALLDELRALLPSLTGTAPAANLAAIADDLEAAITPFAEGEALDRQALREAMTAARDQPRDIDLLVDLSRRIDAVLELIDAHDRCVAAIERAVPSLRAQNAQPEA